MGKATGWSWITAVGPGRLCCGFCWRPDRPRVTPGSVTWLSAPKPRPKAF